MGKKPKKQITKKRLESKPSGIQRQDALDQAEKLIQAGKPEEAIDLLEPLAERYRHDGDLQYMLGYASVKANDTWTAIIHYRKALSLTKDEKLWIPLGFLYLELSLGANCTP